MAQCPICNEEINHLDYVEERTNVGTVGVEDDKLAYDEESTPEIDVKYTCPECESTLAESEDEVKVVLGVK